MLQNNFVRGASGALFLLFICIIGGAQEFRGSITGKVTDPVAIARGSETILIKLISNSSH